MLETVIGTTTEYLTRLLQNRVFISILILLLGGILTKIVSNLSKRRAMKNVDDENKVQKIRESKSKTSKLGEYVIILISIGLALAYLNVELVYDLYYNVTTYLPTILSTFLLAVLGIITVNIIMDVIKKMLETINAESIRMSFGLGSKSLDILAIAFKIFLYIIIIEIALTHLGISTNIINQILTVTMYAAIFLMASIAFFGFKDLVANYAAGIYLKSSNMLKTGRRVKVDDETGEVRDISNFGTTISTDSGYFMFYPNKRLMNKEVMIKRTQAEIDTLEDMKKYFTAQKPSYCGPASAEMALAIFGYDISQDSIGEEADTQLDGGTEPEDMVSSIQNLSKDNVKASYIQYDQITSLKKELKVWLNDGALVILYFMKPVIFPNATTGHYVLAAGIEGDEILVIDPSSKKGGVYYVNHNDMLKAMGEHGGRKRGYIVLAPKGTTAFWRIKEDLVYSHPQLYDKISKNLEVQLTKILRRGSILKNVIPDSVSDFISEWRTDEKITRMWHPESREDENNIGKLDEFTDN